MLKIENFTDDTLQNQIFILPDGTQISITFYFMPMQLGWFIRELIYNDFVLKGFRITNQPNMLHQFRNQIPFGLACITKDNREPTLQEDFSSLNSILYILTSDEVNEYVSYLNGD